MGHMPNRIQPSPRVEEGENLTSLRLSLTPRFSGVPVVPNDLNRLSSFCVVEEGKNLASLRLSLTSRFSGVPVVPSDLNRFSGFCALRKSLKRFRLSVARTPR